MLRYLRHAVCRSIFSKNQNESISETCIPRDASKMCFFGHTNCRHPKISVVVQPSLFVDAGRLPKNLPTSIPKTVLVMPPLLHEYGATSIVPPGMQASEIPRN